MKKISSFTLIELLIVIVIIGILATAFIPRLQWAKEAARDIARISDIRQVQSALTLYKADYGKYPWNNIWVTSGCPSSVWNDPLKVLVDEGYLTSLPKEVLWPGYCYHYSSYTAWTSARYCNGKRRTDYEYSIFFTLERKNSDIFTVVINNLVDKFTHCVVGDLK